MERKRHWELRKLREAIEREWSWKPAKPAALQKVTAYLRGLEKPSKDTLDRLSLFVGFQSWESFRRALNGEAAAWENYNAESDGKDKPKE